MKRASNLYEQIYTWENLLLAFYKAAKGKRLSKATQAFEADLYQNLKNLQTQLITEQIQLTDYRFFKVFDPKERLISVAPFSARVLHHALMNILDPLFDRFQIYDSYACRRNKGTHLALLRSLYFSRRYSYFIKLDMRKYFDSISHANLLRLLSQKFKDVSLLKLFAKIVNSYAVQPGFGLPIGNLTSQYFANFYLGFFDHYAKEVLRVKGYLRYMDDVVLFADSKWQCKQLVTLSKDFLNQQLLLTLKQEVINQTKNGVPFLSFLVKPQGIFLSQKKKKRLKKRVAAYNYKLKNLEWTDEEFAGHITPIFAQLLITTKHLKGDYLPKLALKSIQ